MIQSKQKIKHILSRDKIFIVIISFNSFTFSLRRKKQFCIQLQYIHTQYIQYNLTIINNYYHRED